MVLPVDPGGAAGYTQDLTDHSVGRGIARMTMTAQPSLIVPYGRLHPLPGGAAAQHLSDGMARRDAQAGRALRAREAARLEPVRFSVGHAARRGLHRRAAPRDHVLVRGARELRRLGPGGVRQSDDPRVRDAPGRPDPQVLLLDHARRDEPRGSVPARDPGAGPRRTDGFRGARASSPKRRRTTSAGCTTTAGATGRATARRSRSIR